MPTRGEQGTSWAPNWPLQTCMSSKHGQGVCGVLVTWQTPRFPSRPCLVTLSPQGCSVFCTHFSYHWMLTNLRFCELLKGKGYTYSKHHIQDLTQGLALVQPSENICCLVWRSAHTCSGSIQWSATQVPTSFHQATLYKPKSNNNLILVLQFIEVLLSARNCLGCCRGFIYLVLHITQWSRYYLFCRRGNRHNGVKLLKGLPSIHSNISGPLPVSVEQ